MYFHPDEKVAVFIDGQHLYACSRAIGFDVDYRDFREYFRKQANLVRAYYYAVLVDHGEFSPLKPLTDWLAYNGYSLITRTARENIDSQSHRRILSMDTELITDMFELVPYVDHMVLVAGGTGFRRPIEAIKGHGVRVSVLSSIKTTPAMVADDVRRSADQFIELNEIKGEFSRVRDTERLPSSVTTVATPAEPFAADEQDVAPARAASAVRAKRSPATVSS